MLLSSQNSCAAASAGSRISHALKTQHNGKYILGWIVTGLDKNMHKEFVVSGSRCIACKNIAKADRTTPSNAGTACDDT